MTLNQETKRWMISTGVTFLTGFAMVLLMDINSIDLESLRSGAAVGILFAAFRGGLKAVLEWFLASRSA